MVEVTFDAKQNSAKHHLAERIRTNHSGEEILHQDSTYGYTWQDERSGEKNPQWKIQIKRGQQAGTSLIARRRTVGHTWWDIHESIQTKPPHVAQPGWAEHLQSYGSYLIPEAHLDDFGTVLGYSETEANNEALARYVGKVRNKQTTFQGGTFVGELTQLLRTIKTPFRSARRGMHEHLDRLEKIGRRNRYASHLKKREILADTWLEFSFGWKPLMHDMDDAVQALAESSVLSDPDWHPVRAFGVSETVDDSSVGSTIGTSPGFTVSIVKRQIVTVIYRGLVDIGSYSAKNPRRVGFDVSNWAPTAWEILPWSFLVDYFSNVGDIVNAASLAKSSLRWTLKTVVRENLVTAENWQPKGASVDSDFQIGRVLPGSPGTSWVNTKYVNRDPYEGSLVPNLEFSIPGFGTKWLNMAALMNRSQRLKRFFL